MKTIVKFEGMTEVDIEAIKGDPYAILGVSKDASDDEIKRAYKLLAARYHPDKKAGSDPAWVMNEEKRGDYFLLLGVAKETLLDPKKRALYDEYYIFGNDTAQRTYRDALGQIQGMFLNLLKNAPHLDHTDIKGSIIQGTERAISDTEGKIKEVKANVKKSKKILTRISSTGKKGSRLVHLLEAQMDVNEKQSIAQIGEFKKQAMILEEVLVILDEFECTFEEMEQIDFGGLSQLGGSDSFFGGFQR